MILQLRRWLPHRSLVLVGDNSYAVLDLLHCCQSGSTRYPHRPLAPGRRPLCASATPSARSERSASAERPTPARAEGTPGLAHRVMGHRVGSLVRRHYPHGGTHVANGGLVPLGQAACAPALGLGSGPPGRIHSQALLCTDPSADPAQILEWFVLRWQLEVTFQEVRAHLGVETQRQWSDLAIARTTPILMGLFSWTTLAAHLLRQQRPSAHRTAAWYAKPSPTFVDAIALVRRHLWLASEGFSLSAADPDIRKVPAALYHRLVDSLAYAA